MFYEVAISRPELMSLAGIMGKPLTIFVPVVWCVQLETPDALFSIIPEEVATPDKDHPNGTVDRPMVTVQSTSSRDKDQKPAKVEAINIISTLVSFSPVEMCPEIEIRPGVTIPASEGYGFVYYHPSQLALAKCQLPQDQALIAVDVAIELVTERCPRLTLYTELFSVNASFEGFPDEDWAKLGAWVRRSVPACGSSLPPHVQ